MKDTRLIMGMPITVDIGDANAVADAMADVFNYFTHVDEVFSTYQPTSEISRINAGLPSSQWSDEIRQVLALCEQTKRDTRGYFDITRRGKIDPSGLVKGWAIQNAADLLRRRGLKNFYIDAGGDIQVAGTGPDGTPWKVGIRNPFNRHQNIKILAVSTEGVATSGTYIRGQHIYNPHGSDQITGIVSLTVIGPDIYNADRYATAAFAMGPAGIGFIESLAGHDGYMVDSTGTATLTSGFGRYVEAAA